MEKAFIYGYELSMDLYDCDASKFTKEGIQEYFDELCKVIDMQKHGEGIFWEASELPPDLPEHIHGLSAVQFILTSSITVHTSDSNGAIFINVFSCKKFSSLAAMGFTMDYFGSTDCRPRLAER